MQHRLAQRLGVVGGAFGVVAGVVQTTVRGLSPTWTGRELEPLRLEPLRLGLLTIALALLALTAAIRQQRLELQAGRRAACALVILAPALLCFSTVGRLWYLPGPLLLLAAVLCADSVPATARLLAGHWLRCLLGALGAAELLMAVGASPVILVVGAVGGTALMAAAWLTPSGLALAGLTALGGLPFAAVAWTAVLPVVLLLAATAIAVALPRRPMPRRAPGTSPARVHPLGTA